MNLIDQFVEATSNMAAPEIFRRWCAISMVSAAMSKRVWTCIEDDLKLFANTYIFLVAKPGIGKSRPMEVARTLLRDLPREPGKNYDPVIFTPDEITRERMIQQMAEVFNEGREEGAMSYIALISEFATFMPEPDAAWMQAVARLWDCSFMYERQTKHMGWDTIINHYPCMLAGVQPSWFSEGFPPNAYELGLPARILFIYASEKPEREFFRGRKQVEGLDRIAKQLRKVMGLRGEVMWDKEAVELWREWANAGYPPAPDDPLLEGYSTRRDMHAGKLALIVSAASHPGTPGVTVEDLKTAWHYLFHAEQYMPTALSNAGGNIYKMREETILAFVQSRYAEDKKLVPEREVRRRLGRMVSTTLITPIINELINQQRLKALGTSKAPHRLLKPGRD